MAKSALPGVRVVKIKDLIHPDPANVNRHTPRGEGMVAQSIEQDGLGRSVLITADGQLIAGENVTEQAVDRGIEEVIIVPNDGTRLVAVQRVDVEAGSERAIRMGIADNRAAEVGLNWSAEQLQALAAEGIDLEPFWSAEELAALLAEEPGSDVDLGSEREAGSGDEGKQTCTCPKCGFEWVA